MAIQNATCRKYYETHKEQIRAKAKEWKANNKEKIREKRKAYRQLHSGETAEYNRKYILEHKKEQQEYYKNNKEKIKERHQKYRIAHKDKAREMTRKHRPRINELKRKGRKLRREKIESEKMKYYLDHKDEIDKLNQAIMIERKNKKRKRRNQYCKDRRRTDKTFKLLGNVRSLIGKALTKYRAKKSGRSIKLTGCSIGELKKYIESLFSSGMSWENHGLYGWHLDHIRPCASFDLTKPEEQEKCFHYSNIQPLWAEDNLAKNSFYNGRLHGKRYQSVMFS